MSETYYSEKMGQKREQASTPLSLIDADPGMPYNKRREPTLYNRRLYTVQETIRALKKDIEKDATIPRRLKERYSTLLIGQEFQCSVLAAMDKPEAMGIFHDFNCEVIKMQMREKPWNAFHPKITTAEKVRQAVMRWTISRSGKNEFNERKLQADAETNKIEQKIEQTIPQVQQAKKGILERVLRR